MSTDKSLRTAQNSARALVASTGSNTPDPSRSVYPMYAGKRIVGVRCGLAVLIIPAHALLASRVKRMGRAAVVGSVALFVITRGPSCNCARWTWLDELGRIDELPHRRDVIEHHHVDDRQCRFECLPPLGIWDKRIR